MTAASVAKSGYASKPPDAACGVTRAGSAMPNRSKLAIASAGMPSGYRVDGAEVARLGDDALGGLSR